jgi:hypothetical protein
MQSGKRSTDRVFGPYTPSTSAAGKPLRVCSQMTAFPGQRSVDGVDLEGGVTKAFPQGTLKDEDAMAAVADLQLAVDVRGPEAVAADLPDDRRQVPRGDQTGVPDNPRVGREVGARRQGRRLCGCGVHGRCGAGPVRGQP